MTSSKSLYDYTCVMLDVLYMKQSNSIQPKLIVHCISYSIPHSLHIKCTHTHTHTHTHIHTHTHTHTQRKEKKLLLSSLSLPFSLQQHPKNYQLPSEDKQQKTTMSVLLDCLVFNLFVLVNENGGHPCIC